MLWVMLLLLALPLFAQPTCPSTPAWSPCDLVFDLEAGENPGDKPGAVDLRAEFRSPHHRTYLMHAFREARPAFRDPIFANRGRYVGLPAIEQHRAI